MKAKKDLRKVSRIAKDSLGGKIYYPRLELTGAIINNAGYNYQDTYHVTVYDETGLVIIMPRQNSFKIIVDDETGTISLIPKGE
jgi:hypothetical protein